MTSVNQLNAKIKLQEIWKAKNIAGYKTHAVKPCSSKIQPCTTQVAGHTSDKSHPAKLCETSDTILAALFIRKTSDPNLDQCFTHVLIFTK